MAGQINKNVVSILGSYVAKDSKPLELDNTLATRWNGKWNMLLAAHSADMNSKRPKSGFRAITLHGEMVGVVKYDRKCPYYTVID